MGEKVMLVITFDIHKDMVDDQIDEVYSTKVYTEFELHRVTHWRDVTETRKLFLAV